MKDFPGRIRLAPSTTIWYFRGGDIAKRGDDYIVVDVYDIDIVTVSPGLSYGVPHFTFRADGQTMQQVQDVLKSSFQKDTSEVNEPVVSEEERRKEDGGEDKKESVTGACFDSLGTGILRGLN